eukprot:TCONS_00055433-protein
MLASPFFLYHLILISWSLRGEASFTGWSQPKQKSIRTDKGSEVNTTYAIYKRNPLRCAINGAYEIVFERTMAECAQSCTDDNRCLMWFFHKNQHHCKLYKFTLYDLRLHSMYNPHMTYIDSFELKNPCTENANLCEHGSYCAADRPTESYECKNCLAPFTGQHCNETAGDDNFISATTTDDILFGRAVSCRHLRHYSNIPDSDHTVQYIHPWRDDRKIKVLCKAGYMVLSHVKQNVTTPIREITKNELADGLDLTVPNFRAHTSFLNELYKLIDFDKFQFTCLHPNGTHFGISNQLWLHVDCERLVKYMTDHSANVIPSTHCMTGISGFTGIYKDSVLDSKWSRSETPPDERLFSNVVVLNDGTRYNFGSAFECFDQDGLWTEFKVELW